MNEPIDQPYRPDLTGLERIDGLQHQAAAFAWLKEDDVLRFVLVTSRRTGRWVFPKGTIDQGMSPSEAAAQEALEEAGVVGRADEIRIGHYRTVKIRPPVYWELEVALYPMRIDRILDTWEEVGQRERRLVTMEEAETLVNDPAMLAAAKGFVAPGE